MNDQITALLQSAPYIRLYRDNIFVIKLGGSILADKQATGALAEQCTLLSDLGIHVVLVHGGGPQATEISKKLGIQPTIVAGRRVTDSAVLEVVKMVYAGKNNVDFVSILREKGAPAVGLSGVDAGMVVAEKRPPVRIVDDDGVERQVDFGHVGDVTSVNTDLLYTLLDGGFMPVICCLGADESGAPLNINADTQAEALAVALGAKKLVYLTDSPGVLQDKDDPQTLIPFADAQDLRQLLESDSLKGGMRPKVEACLRAATSGVKRTHIIDGTAPGSLLIELFTGEGCGTMIVGEREKRLYQEKELA